MSRGVIAPRDPRVVMRLARMGSFHQSRLSFMRVLLRRLKSEGWRFACSRFEINGRGEGQAVYTAHGPARSYSLIAFAHDLPPQKRSDRVIATEWDATFTLFDGVPDTGDIERLRGEVSRQEAGRVSERELSLSRANRSARLWSHVVERLASGRQPDPEQVERVGYLMRTTAVYGSGKFGAADREAISDRPEFQAPFQVEMLSVYLTRAFVMDLVEHMARARAPERAVKLSPALRRRFGIGNSTGLGMAPFLLNHPSLLSNWIGAREEALARVRSLPGAGADEVAVFHDFLARARLNADAWRSEHPLQREKITGLRRDLARLAAHMERDSLAGAAPWNRLWRWAEAVLGLEAQEQLLSLMLEPYGALVDNLAARMAVDEGRHFAIDGGMGLAVLRRHIEDIYAWALATDWDAPEAQAFIWYTSEEKLEPRLGTSDEVGLAGYAQPLAPGRDVAEAYATLNKAHPEGSAADFLLRHPEHRHIVRRVQIAARFPYAEIRDNTIGVDLMPIDLLRAKLSFFGAIHFDPRSDRWVRINMYKDAPFPEELAASEADDWTYPPLAGGA